MKQERAIKIKALKHKQEATNEENNTENEDCGCGKYAQKVRAITTSLDSVSWMSMCPP